MERTGGTAAPLASTTAGADGAATCVLLHGVGTTGWMWRALIDDLSRKFTVLTLDLPGHGGSAHRPWRSMADTVAAVAELLSARAGGSGVDVIRLSLGGYVALPPAAARSTTRVPALAGSYEQPLIRRSLGAITAAFPDGAACLVPGAGHGWNGQLPDPFARTVRAHALEHPLPPELAASSSLG